MPVWRDRYLLAVVVTLAAVLVQLAIGPAVHSLSALFCAAVLIAAWNGGVRAGVVSMVLGALAIDYLFLEPRFSLAIARGSDITALASMLGVSAVATWVGETRYAAKRRLRLAGRAERVWRDLFEAAVESSRSVLYDCDIESRTVRYRGSTQALLGHSPEEMPADFDGYLALVHPDDREHFQRTARETSRTGARFSLEYRLRRSDGEYVTVLDDGRLIVPEDGGRAHVVGLIKDVSDRRTAEAQRNRVVAMLDAFSASAPFGLAVVDREFRYVRINASLAAMNGASIDAHLGRTVAEMVPGLWPKIASHFQGVLDTGQPVMGLELIGEVPWHSGDRRTSIANIFPVRVPGEGIVGIGVAVLDVTDRTRAEHALRGSEERFRLAADAVNGIIYEYDVGTGHVERTRGLYEVLGHRPEEVPPTVEWWREQTHPDDLSPVPTRTQLDATRSVMRTMYRVRHKDGGWRHVEDRSVLFHHADGRPVRMVGCTMDVTARVKAEEELRLVAEVAGLGAIRIDYAADTATPDATAADLFGLEAGVSVPRAVVHSRFHADDRDEVMRRMRASFDPHGPGGFAMEHRVVLPDGTMRWLSVRKQVTFGEVDGVRRPTSAVLAAVDVSARRATELRLEESFALLDSLMRNAPVGLSYHDRELRIVRINDYLAAINGLPVEAHIGRRVAEVVPDVWPRLEPLYRSALAGDPVVGVEVEGEVASAPGERRHYVVSCYPVRTADAILGIGVVVADITARKRAEAELNSSQQRLAAVLDATPALVYHMDADDRFVLVNRRFESLFGVTAEGVRGLTPYALFSAEIADAFVMNNRRVREEGRPLTFEEVAPHADGLHFYTSEKAPVVDDGVPVGVVGVSTDITIRRRAEDRTRLLSDAAAVLLSTDEPDVLLRGVFEKIAPAFDLDMYFDFMLDEAGAGLRLASSAGVTDDTARALQRLPFGQHMCGMVALSRRPAYASHVQTSDDPQVALVRGIGIRAYACNPLLSGNTLLGTLSFGSRRRDEFSVEELGFFSTISRYVSAAYERLRLVNELREADRKKDEFLATLAHELRNPLAPIRTGVQVMKLSAGNASMVERSRAMIERQVHQMAHLIDDLMDVSRISMGKVVLQKSRLRLADAVRDAVDISRPLLEAAGHDFTLELPADALVVDGDHTRLTQVFG
ncbi:MAG: PAS domain S-box protein, partial [Gemmatimonadaceae bacterium]|nr:PAS domain S-box protein [Gemmatimonadaceae bacterium]